MNDLEQELIFASIFGDIDMVRLLLADERVDPSADNNAALRLAARNGHLEAVKLLLADERVELASDKNAEYASYLALINGHMEVVKLLEDTISERQENDTI